MAEPKPAANPKQITRSQLADLLNEDLSREYQAIIAYVVYSQVLSGAQYMDIAAQLEIHAKQELDHALILSRQIDYLGKMPVVTPQPVRTSKNAKASRYLSKPLPPAIHRDGVTNTAKRGSRSRAFSMNNW